MQAHHMPQKQLGFLAEEDGGAIVMKNADHYKTRTFGGKGRFTAGEDADLSFRDVLAKDIRDYRNVMGPNHNSDIGELLDFYRSKHPGLINK